MKNYKHQIVLTPRDVLYFRDGRPLGGAADGNGAQWPLPTVWHSAVLSAFHRNFSEVDLNRYAKNHKHPRTKPGNSTYKDKNFGGEARTLAKFGGVKTLGPFPQLKDEIYFPLPADLLPEEKDSATDLIPAQLLPCDPGTAGKSDLPLPLKYVLWKEVKPTKQDPGQWISQEGLKLYIEGKIEAIKVGEHIKKNSDFFDTEARPGIAINPETGTTEDRKFYSAEYLRLKASANMVAFIDSVSVGREGNYDLWNEFCKNALRQPLIFGGQRGVIWSKTTTSGNDLVPTTRNSEEKKLLLKWTLLSPALFNAGWVPGFVNQTDGNVLLKSVPGKTPEESRIQWRERISKDAGSINAQLVAARIGKPVAVSGWKINSTKDLKASGNDGSGAPKATRLLVPAGSVYYFECASEDDAKKLYDSLHGKVKSDLLGEQGYGLGVCSAWEFGNNL